MRFLRFTAFSALILFVSPGYAADPPAFEDFTFKMGAPPKKGAKKLITVQIDPEEQKKRFAPRQTENKRPDLTVPTATYAWFWNQVPTGDAEEPSTRLRSAIRNLSDGPKGASVPGPRLQDLQSIVRDQGTNVLRATIGTGVSPALVLAVISVESSGRSDAQSSAGAQGLMQLMPATAARFGVTDSFSPGANIKGGVAYLDWLLKEFDGDAVLALAGYNAGENAVKKHNGVPPYAETMDYVPKVLAAFQVARGLCKTPPELISDACALNLTQ
ncbi:MAG: lytic transglycosylase domain-containing protein [Pseudomonadota bacterium]